MNFFADFFYKFENGTMKNKVDKSYKFTEEEKKEWLDRYFKKYYEEDNGEVEKEKFVRVKVDGTLAMQKRKCACTVGIIDEKTGELIPPEPDENIKEDKFIMIPYVPDNLSKEMIDS